MFPHQIRSQPDKMAKVQVTSESEYSHAPLQMCKAVVKQLRCHMDFLLG